MDKRDDHAKNFLETNHGQKLGTIVITGEEHFVSNGSGSSESTIKTQLGYDYNSMIDLSNNSIDT